MLQVAWQQLMNSWHWVIIYVNQDNFLQIGIHLDFSGETRLEIITDKTNFGEAVSDTGVVSKWLAMLPLRILLSSHACHRYQLQYLDQHFVNPPVSTNLAVGG